MAAYTPGPGDLPAVFGPYEVLAKLAKGGMGTVYLVRDPRLERQAALKVSRYSETQRPDLLKRFYYEARRRRGCSIRTSAPSTKSVRSTGCII